jgi:undecaprenyl diphosphate synthase
MVEQSNPNHIGVIIDGNRRYAKERNLPSFKGHEAGAEKIKELLDWSYEFNIKELTIYCLSTENLKRDKFELDYLFDLFKKFFKKFLDSKEVKEKEVKIKFIGDLSLVPEEIRKLCYEIEEKTEDYDNYRLNFCFAYGGRLELVSAFNKLKHIGREITEEDISNSLWLKSNPELIIRTGDAIRTSNFLPWQSVYSEWVFLEKMWPEFSKEDLEQAIDNFKKRKRNFGK